MENYFSPSENHKYLISKIVPSLGFSEGTDPQKWKGKLQRKVRQLVGAMPKERCALRPKTLWKREHPLGSIEKVIFRSEERSDVMAYVCLPKDIESPYTFMICLQGHSTGAHNSIGVELDDNSKAMVVDGDRDFGIGCMKRGIAALCIEQRSFGERGEKKQAMTSPHMCHDATMHALLLGRTLLGERIFDVDRGIDYLLYRKDADMKRIGVMGNSGGGTVTIYAAAILPRIAFAMPSCSFSTFKDSIMSIYHCADNYVPGLATFADMSDVMGAFAPKPVVVVTGRDDEIFPLKATRRAFKHLRAIYRGFNAEDKCHLVVGEGDHRFYAEKSWPKMLREIKKII
jgi:dienelactone hydrolase